MEQPSVEIAMYRNEVPEFVPDLLDRVHGHLLTSFSYHAVYGRISREIHSCVLKEHGEVLAVFLFRIDGKVLRVLNEQCAFPQRAIDAFSNYVFAAFPEASMIVFTAVQHAEGALSFPHLAAKRTQDIVLALPESQERYLSLLGKSTRTYIKRYLNKLKRIHPSAAWESYAGDEVSDAHLQAIIDFNRARMAGKYKQSYIDDEETDRIIRLVRQCGLVTVMTIDGKLCAGTINYRVADNFFLQVIAHDPAYDEFGLGTLCCYLTICECISRGGRNYHFLWGRYEYKYRLLGVQRDLSDIIVYRSRMDLLRDGKVALGHAYSGRMYELKDWMEQRARRLDEGSMAGQAAYYCFHGLKKMKRSLDRLRMQQRGEDVSRHLPRDQEKGAEFL
jgi:hypothetical protein